MMWSSGKEMHYTEAFLKAESYHVHAYLFSFFFSFLFFPLNVIALMVLLL